MRRSPQFRGSRAANAIIVMRFDQLFGHAQVGRVGQLSGDDRPIFVFLFSFSSSFQFRWNQNITDLIYNTEVVLSNFCY